MKVRFITSWGKYGTGDVLEPKLPLGKWLVEQRYAECVGPNDGKVETAMIQPATECAMRPRPRARRGGLEYG